MLFHSRLLHSSRTRGFCLFRSLQYSAPTAVPAHAALGNNHSICAGATSTRASRGASGPLSPLLTEQGALPTHCCSRCPRAETARPAGEAAARTGAFPAPPPGGRADRAGYADGRDGTPSTPRPGSCLWEGTCPSSQRCREGPGAQDGAPRAGARALGTRGTLQQGWRPEIRRDGPRCWRCVCPRPGPHSPTHVFMRPRLAMLVSAPPHPAGSAATRW